MNSNIIRSEIEGGVYLEDLAADAELVVKTQNRSYLLRHRGGGEALLSGHPKYCPHPVLVRIHGSNWGGSMLKAAYLGRGMHMEFRHPDYERPIVTSRILEIEQVQ